MKKNKYYLITFVIAIGLFSPLSQSNYLFAESLGDTRGHWAEDAINWGVASGIVNGFEDHSFKPNRIVSYAEFLKMALKSQNYEIIKGSNQDKWYYDYYASATIYDIYRGSVFEAEKPVSRGNVAMTLASFVEDNLLSEQQAVQFLLDKGITKGKTSATVQGFKPADKLTRAEAVQFLMNFKQFTDKHNLDERAKEADENSIETNKANEEIPIPPSDTEQRNPKVSLEQKHQNTLQRIINSFNPTIRREQSEEYLNSLKGEKEITQESGIKIGRGILWAFRDQENSYKKKSWTLQQVADFQRDLYGGPTVKMRVENDPEETYNFIQQHKDLEEYYIDGDLQGLKINHEDVVMVEPGSIIAFFHPGAIFCYEVSYVALKEIPFNLQAGTAKRIVPDYTMYYVIGFDEEAQRYIYLGQGSEESEATSERVYSYE